MFTGRMTRKLHTVQRAGAAESGASRTARMTAVSLLIATCASCEPELIVGEWTCSTESNGPNPASPTDPVGVPWSTGFEERFCEYTEVAGFCYADANASYEVVTSPVHSGRYAAAFHVSASDRTALQARCVRQGVLPAEGYYGAWYFVPNLATNTAVWNLIHFQGGQPSGQHGLWDVSLVNTPQGELRLVVFDFLGGMVRSPSDTPAIPIGEWFHLQLYLKRAADRTGSVALYQDGRKVFEVTNIVTDDSRWGQWYVGNYADGVLPADSTLYVDDVTISATL
jgi:hypothetical protein